MPGEGGTLCIVNGTPYTWKLDHNHFYQMQWKFPDTIAPGASVRQYVEWTTGIKNWFDDAAEARYWLEGSDVEFEIQARSAKAQDGSWDHHLQVYFINMHTANHAVGSIVSLGWKWNGQVNWVVSGIAPNNLVTSSPPSNWMQANLSLLGTRTLRHLCIPGSHDAGMSRLTGGTGFSGMDNTLTQYYPIGDQLAAGSRWFDIRPVISGGKFVTGHYSNLGKVAGGINVGWQGGNGQPIDEIIDQLNAFTANNKELVVFNLSHAYDTDADRNQGYPDLTSAQWMTLCAQLTRINYRYLTTTVDLTSIALNDFIAGGRAAVVLVVAVDVDLGDFKTQGFYSKGQFPFNSTSISKDSSSYKTALDAMVSARPNRDADCLQLSWTVMQEAVDAIGIGESIRDLDEEAMKHLYTDVLPRCNANSYPNQLYTDIFNGNVTALAMAINALYGG